jgi:hypothetical protein
MSLFAEVRVYVKKTLDAAATHGPFDIPLSHLTTFLIQHISGFQAYPSSDRYRKAYNYVIQISRHVCGGDWQIREVEGKRCLSIKCPSVRFKDYTKCDSCNQRVACLLKGLPF